MTMTTRNTAKYWDTQDQCFCDYYGCPRFSAQAEKDTRTLNGKSYTPEAGKARTIELLHTGELALYGTGIWFQEKDRNHHIPWSELKKEEELLPAFPAHSLGPHDLAAGVDGGTTSRRSFVDDVESEAEAEEESEQADTKKIDETFQANTAIWTVDNDGKPISVVATLKSTHKGGRSSAEKKSQGNTGGSSRLSSDEGGHFIGHRFMSDQGAKNLFPQNANLNHSAYKKMENEWADWTNQGFEVRLMVELHPPGEERPTDIIAEYEVFDPKTGNKVFRRQHKFSNSAGEDFERVSKKNMQ